MKLIYTCHHCGLVAELENNTADPQPVPIGWTKNPHIDDTYYWLCPGCSDKEVIKDKEIAENMKDYWRHQASGAEPNG